MSTTAQDAVREQRSNVESTTSTGLPAHVQSEGDDGRDAVARVLGQIMAERHPGTRWSPVEGNDAGNVSSLPTAKTIRLLPRPQDEDALGRIGSGAPPSPVAL
jgi:hypothetical protein